MISNTNIEKMETTPFFRQIESVISLSFDRDTTLKPHIFACYNNEVSSSLYLHNKIIILNSPQTYNSQSGILPDDLDRMIEKLICDMNVNLGKYLPKNIFYEYINRPTSDLFEYIRYIESINMLYTEKSFASAQSFVMYSTGEHTPSDTPSNGTLDHNLLFNRDLSDQHPISSITGLTAALEGKASTTHTHNYLSAITKSMVEQVLTGDITSHSHSKYALLNGSDTEDFKVKTLTASGVGYFTSGLVMFGTEGGSGGNSGLDITELKRYLTTNPEDWKLALSYIPSNIIIEGDYRLTNARSASDVYPWAKAASKPSYSWDEVGAKPNIAVYHGLKDEGSSDSMASANGGWHEPSVGASIGYYNLYSGGSASSIQLKHYYYNNEVYFRKSVDSYKWLSDWNFFWTSANFIPHLKIDGGVYEANTDWNAGFTNRGFVGSVFMGANRPTGADWNFLIQAAHRNGDSDGPSYIFQLGCGMTSHRNELRFRGSRLEEWNTIWSSASLNRPIHTDSSVGIHNNINSDNKIWFDYDFAGVKGVGSVLSFSGLDGGYNVDLMGTYGESRLLFRTKNGDNGVYNPSREIFHTGNANLPSVDWSVHQLLVNRSIHITRASTGSYDEGIRVQGGMNEWCGVFLGTSANIRDTNPYQWNLSKTNADTFRISKGEVSNSCFEIYYNGNIGIGTASPQQKLDVRGAGAFSGTVVMFSTN